MILDVSLVYSKSVSFIYITCLVSWKHLSFHVKSQNNFYLLDQNSPELSMLKMLYIFAVYAAAIGHMQLLSTLNLPSVTED